MKRLILMAVLGVFALGAQAQKREGKKKNAGNGEYAWIKENLNLTETQKIDLDSVNKALRTEMKAAKEKAEKRAAFKGIKEKKDLAYKEVLTTDQWAKLEQYRVEKKAENAAKRKERVEQSNPADQATKRVEKLKIELGLTEEQSVNLKTVYTDFFTVKKEVALDRMNTGDKEAGKDKMKTAAKSMMKKQKGILTTEQLAKLKEQRKEKKGKK